MGANAVAGGQNAGTLRAGSLEYLAFLEHHRKLDSKSLLAPADMDPGFKTGGGKLADCIKKLLQDKPQYTRKTGLQFAVADLSRDKDHPDLAGNRIDEYWEAASSSKIGIAVGAFQLRFDLNAMAQQNAGVIKTDKDLWKFALSNWLGSETWAKTTTPITTAAGQPKLELADRLLLKKGRRLNVPKYALPQPQKMFTASQSGGALQVEFKLPALHGKQLWERPIDRGEFGDVDDLTYIEQLYTAIDASNNEGANEAIKVPGFLFIASVLMQYNLFDVGNANGLWVGRFYPNGDVVPPPLPDPLSATPDGQKIYAAHSARSGVTFMTLLMQNRLVDEPSCNLMREMLDRTMFYGDKAATKKTNSDTRSPVADSLRARGIKVDEVYSKIGIGGRNNYWDIAYVKRTTDKGKKLSYAITIMDSVMEKGDPQDGPMRDMAYDLDQCVVAANS
jgi:hypothetical protein